MTESHAHRDLIAVLSELGEALAVDDDRLVDVVLDRVTEPARHRSGASRPDRRTRFVAAAIFLVAVVGTLAHPEGRSTMARWFGLDGVTVEVDSSRPAEPTVDPADAPGPGETSVLTVEGRTVLFSAIDGRWLDEGITKTVRSSDQISEVRVGEHPGLWISGEPHELAYEAPGGDVVVTRVASNTLLWQDGPVLFRVEGFGSLAGALEFATGT